MKKRSTPLVVSGMFFLLCLLCAQFTYAQQSDAPEAKKKIVIVKKHTDDNGTVTVEKIVKEGVEADELIQDIQTEEDGDTEIDIEIISNGEGRDIQIFRFDNDDDVESDLNIEITDEEGNKTFQVRKRGEGGDVKTFEWSGDGEMPSELEEEVFMRGFSVNKHHKKNKAFLGVVVDNNDGQGVVIDKVVEGSAAEAASLQVGDVITKINGKVIKDHDDLTRALKQQKPGDNADIEYLRGGNSSQTATTLGERSTSNFRWDDDYNFDFNFDHNDYNEFRFERDNDRPCVFIGVFISTSRSSKGDGCKINSVISGTPAETAQMEGGDIITAINGVSVGTYRELLTERNKYNPGDQVTLSVTRNGQSIQKDITFEECDKKENTRSSRIIIINKAEELPGEEEEIAELETPAVEFDPADVTLQLENFQAFPNPASSYINIRFEAEATPINVTIVDVAGREIFRDDLNRFDGIYNRRIDLSRAAKGTLLLSIRQNDKVFTQALVRSDSAGL
ncbi:MAG: PDZ domain-containing protein [Bacteroidota bacterium]